MLDDCVRALVVLLTEAVGAKAGAEAGARGFLVLNPPYGLRLEGGDREFFRRLGSHVRRSFAGFRSLVLFPSEETLRAFGGRPAERFALSNDALKTSGTSSSRASRTSRAARSIVPATDSITHGPAMNASRLPPKTTPPTLTCFTLNLLTPGFCFPFFA